MSFLGSIFGGGGASNQAYQPVQTISPEEQARQNQLYGQQQQFIQALQQQASGQGPSAAGMMLDQALQKQQGANFGQAQATRGVSPALAMRQAMQANAQEGQNTAQQAALSRVQEQLGAQSQLGGAIQGAYGQQLQGQEMGLKAQGMNRQIGQAQNKAQGDIFGGILGGLGSLAGLALADGGVVPSADEAQMAKAKQKAGVQNIFGSLGAGLSGQNYKAMSPLDFLQAKSSIPPVSTPNPSMPILGPQLPGGGFYAPPTAPKMAEGGKVKAMVSPGEIYIPPGKAKDPKEAQKYAAEASRSGKKIPGKARVKGDSLENDTVSKELDEGGIVVPRSKSTNAEDAAAFVRALLAAQRGKNG